MKKGQTWSTDALVAVVLFIMAAIMLYYLSGTGSGSKVSDSLQRDSETLPRTLGSEQNSSAAFVKGTKIDTERLAAITNMSYESIKDQLGLDSDFCIYLEDEKGNLIPLDGKMGVGSPYANLSGKGCNESISAG